MAVGFRQNAGRVSPDELGDLILHNFGSGNSFTAEKGRLYLTYTSTYGGYYGSVTGADEVTHWDLRTSNTASVDIRMYLLRATETTVTFPYGNGSGSIVYTYHWQISK